MHAFAVVSVSLFFLRGAAALYDPVFRSSLWPKREFQGYEMHRNETFAVRSCSRLATGLKSGQINCPLSDLMSFVEGSL
jgi:hypothetical protein